MVIESGRPYQLRQSDYNDVLLTLQNTGLGKMQVE